MNECKYKFFDEIVADSLSYFLSLNDKEYKIDYFKDTDTHMFFLQMMYMASNFNGKKIYISMPLFSYLKFKIKYKNMRKFIKRKKFPKKELPITIYYHKEHICEKNNWENKYSEIKNNYDIFTDIYKTYYKGE